MMIDKDAILKMILHEYMKINRHKGEHQSEFDYASGYKKAYEDIIKIIVNYKGGE